MPSSNVNPFYIEPNQQHDEPDEWDWEDDKDDLEELLGDAIQHPNQRNQHSGGLPVPNLAYEPNGTRVRYIAAAFVVVIILILMTSSGGSNNNTNTATNDGSMIHHHSGDEKTQIVVLGERHSGVEWLEHSLRLCFPDCEVSSTLSRVGYFFQDQPEDLPDTDVHVVVVALNPYDWVDVMRKYPQYMPNHANIDDWREFLRKDWTIERPERDYEMEGKHGKVCQMGFAYDEVVSCVKLPEGNSSTNPIYELKQDGSGAAFKSILDLRAAKFRNQVEEMSDWVHGVNKIRYESLVEPTTDAAGNAVPGIYDLLEKLAADLKMDWQCKIRAAEPGRSHVQHTQKFVKYMNKHVDWDAEELFGYTPLDEPTPAQTIAPTEGEEETPAPTIAPTEPAAEQETLAPTIAPTEPAAEQDTLAPTPVEFADVIDEQTDRTTAPSMATESTKAANDGDDKEAPALSPKNEEKEPVSNDDDGDEEDDDDDEEDGDDEEDDDEEDDDAVVDNDDEGGESDNAADPTLSPTAATHKPTPEPTIHRTHKPTSAPTATATEAAASPVSTDTKRDGGDDINTDKDDSGGGDSGTKKKHHKHKKKDDESSNVDDDSEKKKTEATGNQAGASGKDSEGGVDDETKKSDDSVEKKPKEKKKHHKHKKKDA